MVLLRVFVVLVSVFAAGSAFGAAARQGAPATRGSAPSTVTVVASQSGSNADVPDYVLQPHDLIRVEVFQEPDLLKEVRLSQDSVITLPLINAVSLKGLTVQSAEALIRSLYGRDYLVNPQVNVLVLEYAKREVQVLGHLNNPGAVPIPSDRPLRITAAIAGAGGTTRLAARNRVAVVRQQRDGTTETITVNLDDIFASRAEDIVLQAGDVINVPERIL